MFKNINITVIYDIEALIIRNSLPSDYEKRKKEEREKNKQNMKNRNSKNKNK